MNSGIPPVQIPDNPRASAWPWLALIVVTLVFSLAAYRLTEPPPPSATRMPIGSPQPVTFPSATAAPTVVTPTPGPLLVMVVEPTPMPTPTPDKGATATADAIATARAPRICPADPNTLPDGTICQYPAWTPTVVPTPLPMQGCVKDGQEGQLCMVGNEVRSVPTVGGP